MIHNLSESFNSRCSEIQERRECVRHSCSKLLFSHPYYREISITDEDTEKAGKQKAKRDMPNGDDKSEEYLSSLRQIPYKGDNHFFNRKESGERKRFQLENWLSCTALDSESRSMKVEEDDLSTLLSCCSNSNNISDVHQAYARQSLSAERFSLFSREGTTSITTPRIFNIDLHAESTDLKSDAVKQVNTISRATPWRKILYERQPFEDNYVDPVQFLHDLRANDHVKTYQYTDVVKDTFVIAQQISIVVLFVCAFTAVLNGTIGHYTLLYVDLFVLLMSFIIYLYIRCCGDIRSVENSYYKTSSIQLASRMRCTDSQKSTDGRWAHDRRDKNGSFIHNGRACVNFSERRNGLNFHASGAPKCGDDIPLNVILHLILRTGGDFLRKVVSLGSLLVLLSSILSTLTVSYSSDTIVMLSILTMSLHVLTANYSYLNAYTNVFSPNLSINAASFGVILMASRIPSPLESGALMAFGAFCFSLSPIPRHLLKRASFAANITVTTFLCVLAAVGLLSIPILAILFVTIILMICFIIPWWFVALHSSVKKQINGPWDEAKPTNSVAAAEWANVGLLS